MSDAKVTATRDLEYEMFYVGTNAHCVWEYGIAQRQLEFVKSIEPEHFPFLYELLAKELAGEKKQRAACQIRATYSHALETFFALLLSAIQAPRCGYAWLLQYKPGDLPMMTSALLEGRPIPTPLKLNAFTLDHVAEVMTPHPAENPQDSRCAKVAFARAWKRFAFDFTNELWTTEYNSIKHGMRVSPGGMTLAFRLASDTDKPYQSLGGSEFGSQFFARQYLHEKLHFRGRRHTVNWNPTCLGHRIHAIGASIQNVRGMLLGHLGEDISDYPFIVPEADNAFDACWADDPRVTNVSFDINIRKEDINCLSKSEVEQILNASWNGIASD